MIAFAIGRVHAERGDAGMAEQTAAAVPVSMELPDSGAGDLRLRETLLTILASFSGIAAFGWGSIYLWFSKPVAAALPLACGAFSFGTVALMRLSGHLVALLRAPLVMILLTPFLLALALGGFVGSGGPVIWSLLAPIGAFLIRGRRGVPSRSTAAPRGCRRVRSTHRSCRFQN